MTTLETPPDADDTVPDEHSYYDPYESGEVTLSPDELAARLWKQHAEDGVGQENTDPKLGELLSRLALAKSIIRY